MITPLPGAMNLKPGSASKPFPGIVPRVLKEDGTPAGVNEGGYLVIEKPWPGMLRGTFGDPENKRVKDEYFSRFPGKYFTGDGARYDENGDFWLLGRIDDVLSISGHRIATAEVESALVSHATVAEAAVVGFPHDIKGEGIYAYVVLKGENEPSESLTKILRGHVREVIGSLASPEKIQFTPGLPKTRSGKIMRRILRKVAFGDLENLGDTSTLADPSVVDAIIKNRL
jgi:acetyl-CoA synthetase